MAILTTSFQKLAESYLGTDSYNHSLYIRTYARYTEQDIVNNRSYVIYQARTQFNGTYIQDNQGSYSLSGTGASGSSGGCTRPTNGEVTIATTEGWVYHNDNGTKSISTSATLKFPNWGWSATASSSADLPTIPRASSIAVGNYNLGQNLSITIGKKVSSFTSALTYKIGSRTGAIATKTSSSTYVWEMSDELISQIKKDNPSNKNVSAIIYCETYSGDTKIGSTQSASFTLVIVDKPTISDVMINETIELIKQYTTSIVKYLSVPQFNMTANPSEGTSISTYKVKIGDREITSSTNGLTINNIQYSYLVEDVRKTKFIVTVTDARGNISEEYPIEVDFIEYVQLAFNNTDIALTRLNGTSNFIKLHITGYIYNGLIGETQNYLIIQYRYKLKNDETAEWSDLKTIEATLNDDDTFIIDNLQLEDEFDYRKNYDIEFFANDLFLKSVYSTVIKTSETIAKWHKDGLDVKNLTINKKQVLYEEIQEQYSTEEQIIGTWIDKKPLYMKVLSLGSIELNSGANTFSHGIDNLETVANMNLIMKYTNGNWYHNWDMYKNITIGSSIFTINISSDSENTIFSSAYVILKYTKTTDIVEEVNDERI